MRRAGKRVEAKAAQNLAQSIVGDAKARVSEKNPLVSGKIDYAGRPLRVQIAVPPAIEQGARSPSASLHPKPRVSSNPRFCLGKLCLWKRCAARKCAKLLTCPKLTSTKR